MVAEEKDIGKIECGYLEYCNRKHEDMMQGASLETGQLNEQM